MMADQLSKKKIIPINLINLTVVICIMLFIGFLTQNIIGELTSNDIQNVTRLSQANIYAEITQELLDPVNTALIMAQNTYLIKNMISNVELFEKEVADYLHAIQKSTGYESVFLVSHKTLDYFHPGGSNAKVDLDSEESLWYRERINSSNHYSVAVNTEQLDNWAFTMYVNANIYNHQGEFIGVTGVGKRITHIQDILKKHMESLSVEAYLIDNVGQIQVHLDEKMIQNNTIYDNEEIARDKLQLTKDHEETMELLIGDKLMIVQYIPMLDWYLVVTKSTSQFELILDNYSAQMYLGIATAIVIMMLTTSFTINRYKKQVVSLSNIDKLTVVYNRRIFENKLQKSINNLAKEKFCLALFDIDDLKIINDRWGHDQGDMALRTVANTAKSEFGEDNIISRIGGDEFALIIYSSLGEARVKVERFHEMIQANTDLISVKATLSVGLTESKSTDSGEAIFKRADRALYVSKESGRNRITIE